MVGRSGSDQNGEKLPVGEGSQARTVTTPMSCSEEMVTNSNIVKRNHLRPDCFSICLYHDRHHKLCSWCGGALQAQEKATSWAARLLKRIKDDD